MELKEKRIILTFFFLSLCVVLIFSMIIFLGRKIQLDEERETNQKEYPCNLTIDGMQTFNKTCWLYQDEIYLDEKYTFPKIIAYPILLVYIILLLFTIALIVALGMKVTLEEKVSF